MVLPAGYTYKTSVSLCASSIAAVAAPITPLPPKHPTLFLPLYMSHDVTLTFDLTLTLTLTLTFDLHLQLKECHNLMGYILLTLLSYQECRGLLHIHLDRDILLV